MQMTATVARVTPAKSNSSDKEFLVLDLAENYGQGQSRATTWYKGLLFSPKLQQLVLQGQLVEVQGQLTKKLYQRRDGTTDAELSLVIDALKVKAQPKPRGAQPDEPPAHNESRDDAHSAAVDQAMAAAESA